MKPVDKKHLIPSCVASVKCINVTYFCVPGFTQNIFFNAVNLYDNHYHATVSDFGHPDLEYFPSSISLLTFQVMISDALKLLPMTGTGWIRVIFAISGHFAFLVKSEKCLENVSLIFLAHNVKYKGEKIKKWA